MKCPKCRSDTSRERDRYGVECQYCSVCEQYYPTHKCGHEEKVKPFDPNEKPDWEAPSKEEADRYLEVMGIKKVKP